MHFLALKRVVSLACSWRTTIHPVLFAALVAPSAAQQPATFFVAQPRAMAAPGTGGRRWS